MARTYLKDIKPKMNLLKEKRQKQREQRLDRLEINKVLHQLGYPKYLLRDEALKEKLYDRAKQLAQLIVFVDHKIETKKNIPLLKIARIKAHADFFIDAMGKYFQLTNTERPTQWMTLVNCALQTYNKAIENPYAEAHNEKLFNNMGNQTH